MQSPGAYHPPTKKFSLHDLKLKPKPTSTEIAATVPFPILSQEGVRAYRRSLFQANVLKNCASSPYPGTLVLRNAAEHSKFINDFWTHPVTCRIVSEAAGVPLSIIMRTEIGHTNIQGHGSTVDEMLVELSVEPDATKTELTEEEKAYDPLVGESIIPWHYDSFPYVEGPAIGWAVVLQGGEVQHLATRGLGVKERISTITSYRADIPQLYDSSHISNIRPYSDLQVLYKEWTQYRLRKMKSEIESLELQIVNSCGPVDVSQVHEFAEQQIAYLKRTARQLIPYEHQKSQLSRFGRLRIFRAANVWEKAEMLPTFDDLAYGASSIGWRPDSPLWLDLAESLVEIERGKELESQTGNFKWEKKRKFSMGDELLRQGLAEMFLDWLDFTGLYQLVQI
ncbi:hypothetical protein OIDMADRAFT_144194 [Oidiodendron maius Zn]|uniref:Uncharacterized protein n=1 Tax=Oidiodendron maius (strain Zn) TaxID=913774 RepID=A0A0C3HLG0_OIDMZ|nr:hypothetical protein OIDMADRAFT_144194 [Oidiodendron maius Zn]